MAEPARRWRLIYDGDCPFCRRYCRRFGELAELIDFRSADAADLPAGRDPDRALLLDTGAEVLSGAAALRRLAGTPAAGRLDRLLFGNPRRGRLIYPVLRALRDALLRVRGRYRTCGRRRREP